MSGALLQAASQATIYGFGTGFAAGSDTGFLTQTYQCRLSVYTDGTLGFENLQAPDIPGVGFTVKPPALHSGLYIRCTLTSGTFTGGSGTGTWLSLASVRSWYVTGTTSVKSASFDLELATDSGGTNIVASKSWSIQAGEIA